MYLMVMKKKGAIQIMWEMQKTITGIKEMQKKIDDMDEMLLEVEAEKAKTKATLVQMETARAGLKAALQEVEGTKTPPPPPLKGMGKRKWAGLRETEVVARFKKTKANGKARFAMAGGDEDDDEELPSLLSMVHTMVPVKTEAHAAVFDVKVEAGTTFDKEADTEVKHEVDVKAEETQEVKGQTEVSEA